MVRRWVAKGNFMKAKSRAALFCLAVAAAALTASQAEAAKITIVNGTRVAMVSLQAKPSPRPKWSDDLLNRHSLGVGRAVLVDLPPGQVCMYDFFAMFYDGHKVQKNRVNICKPGPVTITDI